EFPPDRAFHRDNLQSDDNRKVVEKYLSRLVGRRIQVTTVLAGAGGLGEAPATAADPEPSAGPTVPPAEAAGTDGAAAGEGDDDVLNSPAVREALRLFGGRIIHV